MVGTIVLLVLGAVVFGLAEWTNPMTLGPMQLHEKLLATLTGSVFPRTAGFNAVDYAHITDSTVGLYYVLMFIGGGSAGTAGGIKIGTLGIIVATVLAEIRGERQVVVAHRAISAGVQRSALTMVVLSSVAVATATVVMLVVEHFTLQELLFEAISAFGTVGLSMGITAKLRPPSLVALMMLMYLGRVGIVSAATAFAVNAHHRRFVLPEEQVIVG